MDPKVFWAMAVLTLLACGAMLQHVVTGWYLRWRMRQRDERKRNTPSVLRQKAADLERLNEELCAETEGLKLEKAELLATAVAARSQSVKLAAEKTELEVELKRLIDRNTFLANEVRSDPNAETLALPERSFHQGRWVYEKGPEAPTSLPASTKPSRR